MMSIGHLFFLKNNVCVYIRYRKLLRKCNDFPGSFAKRGGVGGYGRSG